MRPATLQDMPELVGMAEAFAKVAERPLAFDRSRTSGVLASLINSPDGLVLIAAGGFIAAQVTVTNMSRERVAVEHCWYFRSAAGLSLLRAYEDWAREKGAKLIRFTSFNDRVAAVLRRAGYQPAEQVWTKAA